MALNSNICLCQNASNKWDLDPAELLKKNKKTEEDYAELDEHKALSVLQRWKEIREFCEGACPLVTEHVEVRSLLNAEKPGLPQVRLHRTQYDWLAILVKTIT